MTKARNACACFEAVCSFYGCIKYSNTVFELGGVRFYVLSTSILTSGRGVSRCEIEN